MKKKLLKKHLKSLRKKCECLELIVRYQSMKLEAVRYERIRAQKKRDLNVSNRF